MSIAEPMAMELEYESANTRKILERVPEDKFDWQPHAKSMTLRQLASHLAEALTWLKPTIDLDEFVMDMEAYQPYQAAGKDELLKTFGKNLQDAIDALKGVSDGAMVQTWRMKCGDKIVFEMPRVAVIRNMILNHSIHHRAQLGVYLRLNDVAVPKVYGPTADEPDF